MSFKSGIASFFAKNAVRRIFLSFRRILNYKRSNASIIIQASKILAANIVKNKNQQLIWYEEESSETSSIDDNTDADGIDRYEAFISNTEKVYFDEEDDQQIV